MKSKYGKYKSRGEFLHKDVKLTQQEIIDKTVDQFATNTKSQEKIKNAKESILT